MALMDYFEKTVDVLLQREQAKREDGWRRAEIEHQRMQLATQQQENANAQLIDLQRLANEAAQIQANMGTRELVLLLAAAGLTAYLIWGR